MKLLGSRIKTLRKSKKFSQEDLAGKIGKSVETISNIERGKFFPRIETALEISKALDIELYELFQFYDISEKNKIKHTQLEAIVEKLKTEPEEIVEFTLNQLNEVISLRNKITTGGFIKN